MFSPYERVYNTPDVSVPAAEAILQQVRLERILKRFGYFACCKPADRTNDTVAPPLVTLGPPAPTRCPRLFGAHEAFTGWQRSRNIQIPKPKTCPKVPKSGIPRPHINDSYLQHQTETVGGGKYGGVHLSYYGLQEDTRRPDIFKPFLPLKSPQRLPALQRERNKKSELNLQATDFYKHVQLNKKRNTELKKPPVKISKKRKKKKKIEMEFMKWEANQEQYFDKSVTDLHNYVNNRDKNIHASYGTEQLYREQIQSQIKRGVHQRVESFGHSGRMLTKPHFQQIPVLDMEFEDTAYL